MAQATAEMDTPTVWRANRGGQSWFLRAPHWEVLADGNRGGGKSDALLFDYLQHVGQGFGAAWRGILFRQTFPQLGDFIARSRKWIPQVFPGAEYNKAQHEWSFPQGETLLMRYMSSPEDYQQYHGHEYPWIGFEELTNWPTGECYERIKSCSRSSKVGMPRKIRANTNSYGVGHAWVKAYFVDPMPPMRPYGERGLQRVRIPISLQENTPFLEADPDYTKRLAAIDDDNLRKAWLEGSWDISAGSYFAHVWDSDVHVVQPFQVPQRWQITRAHDWGSAKPFCTLWIATTNGESDLDLPNAVAGLPAGSMVVIAEDYGWTGVADEGIRLDARGIAQRIKQIEHMRGWQGRVSPGPGDDPLFEADRLGTSMAEIMAQDGVYWLKPKKGSGSRVAGWQAISGMLAAAKQHPREFPSLLIVESCRNLLRTLPTLAADKRNFEDVDTTQEDHAADALRLAVLAGPALPSKRVRVLGH